MIATHFARILLVLACLALVGFGAAQEDEDALFDGEDGLFDDAIVTEAENDPDANPADDLLASEGVAIGGRFRIAASMALGIEPEHDAEFSSGLVELGTQLYLDARPSSDFRVFTKGDLTYRTDVGASFALDELFADVAIDDTVFLRAGKQTINWGVGYFFSPANLVNLERVDPEDPDEELAGPVAIKAQLPLGTNNLTGYAILEDIGRGNRLSAAARYEFLVEGYEVTTGAIVEDIGHWAIMATGTGAIAGATVFAETVIEGNSTKLFVVRDPGSPLGLAAAPSDSLFVSATVGGSVSYTTQDDLVTVAATAQYFFNGLGYDDTSILTENPAAVAALLAEGELTFGDLLQRGRHHLGVSASSPNFLDLNLTPSVLWLASMSDGSGLVSAGLTWSPIDHVVPRLDYRYLYGAEGTEYAFGGPSHTVTASVSISGQF